MQSICPHSAHMGLPRFLGFLSKSLNSLASQPGASPGAPRLDVTEAAGLPVVGNRTYNSFNDPKRGNRQGRSVGMEESARALADFVRDHQAWAAPIVLVLAFGESLAFISLLIPAWGALVAIGALIGASGISFWPVWIAGGIGAALGDWVSYWFGYRYKEHVAQMWPLSRYPEILPRGEAFVKRWGVPSIFIGRFFGPLRASVPLAAGIFEMPYWQFQIANFVSAFVWAAALLLFGDVIAQIVEWLWRAV